MFKYDIDKIKMNGELQFGLSFIGEVSLYIIFYLVFSL
jgi:hypothetical protein